MSLQTVKAIKNLELASVCNLACPYCPCRLQGAHREVGLMNDDVFDWSLYWIEKFVKRGTQKELNMFGVGESTLHPKMVEFVRRTRRVMPPYLPLLMNTNGINFTEEMCRELMDAGIDKIDLTDHVAEASTKTIRIFRKTGVRHGYSRDAIVNPNNWGGLVDWVNTVDYHRYTCPWLNNGQVMIMSNGDVTRCCQDAFARGVICTVYDEVDTIPYSTFVQCASCHEDVPDWITPHTEKESA